MGAMGIRQDLPDNGALEGKHAMILHFCLLVILCAGAVLLGAAAIGGQNGRRTYLAAGDFPANLAGWERVGEAEFALDEALQFEGSNCARIRIAPGAPLSYQQLRRDFGEDVRPGDEVQAVVWVRSANVDQSPGAYLALECLSADDQRTGIFHSATSKDNGSKVWDRLEASGRVPEGTVKLRLSLILHAHGTAWFSKPSLVRVGRQEPWPDLGDRTRTISVDFNKAVTERFGGVGFHAFHHIFEMSQQDLDEVVYKRWREMNPSFVRMNDHWDYDRTVTERIAGHMARMKQTGTEIYLTTWNPPDVQNDEELRAWARRVADNLEFYVRTRGLTNVRTYCMTNELSLGRWGSLVSNLPRFKQYHEALFREIQSRHLPVGLLATDASPVGYWHTIEWAARNMDEITAVYGGHHYFNESPLEDERFYPWFLERLRWAVGIARARGKPFILGEFGARQDSRTINGVLQDRCIYFETEKEPLVTIQLAEAVIAALNAGVYGMGYWTFMDLPDDFAPGYINKWGTFRYSGTDRSTRAIYYGYALLTRYFRGPARVLTVSADDPRVRAAAVRNARGGFSIAVVNRNRRETPVRLRLTGSTTAAQLRRYVYDPAAPPNHPFGDLPGPAGTVSVRQGVLSDRLAPMSLTVYTSAFDEVPPAPVRGLRTRKEGGAVLVSWQASPDRDLCYYRVYRVQAGRRTQIRSTIATQVRDENPPPGTTYHLTAVDFAGNESR